MCHPVGFTFITRFILLFVHDIDAAQSYSHLPKLSRLFKDSIAHPMIQLTREGTVCRVNSVLLFSLMLGFNRYNCNTLKVPEIVRRCKNPNIQTKMFENEFGLQYLLNDVLLNFQDGVILRVP